MDTVGTAPDHDFMDGIKQKSAFVHFFVFGNHVTDTTPFVCIAWRNDGKGTWKIIGDELVEAVFMAFNGSKTDLIKVSACLAETDDACIVLQTPFETVRSIQQRE
jgi:hypothetical protein